MKMERFNKYKNKDIWMVVFWIFILSLAFYSATCSRTSKAQPPTQDFTCIAESPGVVTSATSPDRPTAEARALRLCQQQSPRYQQCTLVGCMPF